MKPLTALASVLESAVFHADATGAIIESNPAFTQLMRCVTGDDWRINVDQSDRALVDSHWATAFSDTAEETNETLRFHLSGVENRFELRSQAVTNDDGAITSVVAIIEQERSADTPRWSTDPSTGLPETDAAIGRFEEYSDQGRTFAGAVVLLSEDQAHDEIRQKEAARQLLTTIRPTDLLTTSADGRFVLCAAGVDSEAAADAMAFRMLQALEASSIEARIGLVLPHPDAGPATLLREAEAGAYCAELGSSSFAPE